ncbi:MAG: PEP-CTERM sorting domain-containing protein [Pseudomonadota bacterium]|nr:PEP-CTERM sorting domain-containing protein [Pseudomonadota bacterium]
MHNFFSKHSKQFVSTSLALLACMVLRPCFASAPSYVLQVVQQGNRVIASGSGAFDLSGLTAKDQYLSVPAAVLPSVGYVYTGEATTRLDGYTGFSGPTSVGTGDFIIAATTATGDAVGIFGSSDYYGFPLIFVPTGYVSGTALMSSATWDNESFANLGVTPGTFTWTWGTEAGQSFTLTATATTTAVPEPAVLGMFGLGLIGVGGFLALRGRQQRPEV